MLPWGHAAPDPDAHGADWPALNIEDAAPVAPSHDFTPDELHALVAAFTGTAPVEPDTKPAHPGAVADGSTALPDGLGQ